MTLLVSIDGNIGSGKSTLLKLLEDKLKSLSLGEYMNEYKIIFLQEPIDEWIRIKSSTGDSILKLFYGNQRQYSFSFQMMAYISRLDLIKNAILNDEKCIIISERSVHTDRYVFAKMLYDNDLMEDVNYEIYNRWLDSFIHDIPLVGIVYLDVQPLVCKDRILSRNRSGEEVDLCYLESCKEYHDEYVKRYTTLVLDGNDVLSVNEDEFVRRVGEFIYERIKFVKSD